ncbi:hypothetical protein GPECTOR_17g983 [Gonium pectorale]|uniref:Uncharacterized protein n=1 Tax=Gonium pectorale TaxID=33097 RepID=A0A150GKL0_GONPE|nr:hypothetical protein GPECTOR_17g983 [Gonium pectorale]|eukprot:KXZ50342.1 hypothetical protein GPECTOR_17g983 [Gonium pectorale]
MEARAQELIAQGYSQQAAEHVAALEAALASERKRTDEVVASSIAILISNDKLPPGAANADRATMQRILNYNALMAPPRDWIRPELVLSLRTVIKWCRD